MDCFVFLNIEIRHLQKLSVWTTGGILITQRNKHIITHHSTRSITSAHQTLIFPKRNNTLQPP